MSTCRTARLQNSKLNIIQFNSYSYETLFTIISNYAPHGCLERGGYAQTWEKVALKDLTSSDVFVIVSVKGSNITAMSNDKGTSAAPMAVDVTLNSDKSQITSIVADNLKWNVAYDETSKSYTFYPNGVTDKWLYCTTSNNGVRVGVNDNKAFTEYAATATNYSGLKNTGTNRYIGVYTSDWRCYTSVNSNIKGQDIYYYKYVDGQSSDKTKTELSFPKNTITYATDDDLSSFTGQQATLKANDEVLTGKTITYSKTGDDIFASFNESDGTLSLNGTVGTATITAKFDGTNDGTYNSSTAQYTINVKSVIADIATLKGLVKSTSSSSPNPFTLKLTDAIVTYTNGNYAYIQDATGGLYSSAAGFNLENNDKVNGYVDLKIYKNRGQNQVNNWVLDENATIEKNAEFTPAVVTIAELNSNIDKYENMQVRIVGATVNSAMSSNQTKIIQDGSDIILYDKAKLTTWELKADDYVDVVGFPCTYSNTKEICVWRKGDVTVNTSIVKTTLSFDKEETTFEVKRTKESSFVAPKAAVKDANGNLVEGAAVVYESSKPEVATVDGEGNVTFVAAGTTIITASYAGDATHFAAKSISYTINYVKLPTTMAFSAETITIEVGKKPAVPTVALTSDGEDILEGKVIAYSSSNENVAMVDEATGEVVLGDATGTTTITAKFAGDETYDASSASYTLTVFDPNEVTFDFTSNTTQQLLEEGTEITSNGVVITVVKNGNTKTRYNSGTLRIYNGNALTMSAPAGYYMTKVSFVDDGHKASNLDITPGAFNNNNWTGAAKMINMSIPTSNPVQAFLESITVTLAKIEDLSLSEDDNDVAILENGNAMRNVTISRTMIADGGWYTFCVPFDVDDISTTALKDAEVRAYSSMSGSTMNFVATTSLKSCHAYLVKPMADITSPVFEDVVITLGDGVKDGTDGYQFVGITSAYDLKTDGTELFLGAENKFYEPTESDKTLKALRGYFIVPDATSASKMNISIDGETTSISGLHLNGNLESGKVYNLNGQYLGNDVKRLGKGIYVVNGKKYIVK